jgi:drug/metabolite transporter (DMT)-like permease
VWGVSFAILSIIQMHVLHKHDTSGVFPFTSLASNVLVVIGGVFFLHNSISTLQWAAIVLAVLLFIGAHLGSKKSFIIEILPSFMFIALLSTFNKFVQNAGANHIEVNNFTFWQLFFTFVSSLVMLFFVKKQISFSNLVHRHLIGWALLIGVLQFGTNYAIVHALSLGPISLVFIVLGLYTFFTTVFAAILFKEKITTKKLAFIILSFLVVLLIKLGN